MAHSADGGAHDRTARRPADGTGRRAGSRGDAPSRARPGRTAATAACCLALLSPGPAAAAPTPSATGSSAAISLPVIPTVLNGDECTGGSGRVAEPVPWAQQHLGLSRVWQLSRGEGVTVGVVDTGLATRAGDFAHDVGGSAAGRDCVGHGTFVAGLIAGAPRPGSGFSGVAPGARVLAERGTDTAGAADARLTARGIRAAVAGGASVVHVSAALPRRNAELTEAVRDAVARDVLVVAPAVPDAPPPVSGGQSPAPEAYWPAAVEGVLAVAPHGADGSRPQEVKPAGARLSAPGYGVTGRGPAGKGHFVGNGASVAAAFVAGTAALIRSYDPDLTASEVAGRLHRTGYPADPPWLDPYAALTATPADGSAGGRTPPGVLLPRAEKSDGSLGRALALTAAGAGAVLALAGAAALVRRKRSAA
ncbi:S8 family serine peptidase [Streptomyces sp. NPDC087226]|uniref:S8 family serine peptidase n=1 Tax=Streptomyces sp. NPDC087226 TaxID=3365771 RepID=UPI003805B379